MYNSKLFFFYLIGGTIAVCVLMYDVTVTFPVEDFLSILEDIACAAILYFLAYKSYNNGLPEKPRRQRHRSA